MRIRNARDGDLSAVEALLVASALPTDGVKENLTDFIVAEEKNRITGVIGLERFGSFALLRSAAVAPDQRGAGIGSRLVNAIVDRAVNQGVKELYLLTTTAENYFPKF